MLKGGSKPGRRSSAKKLHNAAEFSLPGRPKDFLGDGFKAPELEEKVLDFWKTNAIFEKSLASRINAKTFVFYEGPPSANGRPGLHHVISRVFKDVVCRYKTMRGYSVPRKSGWDTHGLPVEIAAEKELGLKNKKEIEAYGIAEFNAKCRSIVWNYQSEWTRFTDRIGFWLDLKDPYVTYENNYIESLWWIVSQFAKKDLLYQGHRIVNWCPRCGTGLSSHEVGLGYKEVIDQSVYVKFRLKAGQHIRNWKVPPGTYVLAWTTTPWTLPGNVALAVGEDIDYVVARQRGSEEYFIFAKERAAALGISLEGATTVKGRDLAGLEYEPLFEVPSLAGSTSYKIYPAEFVTTEDGTGVVHTAVMYGEDDYQLGKKLDLPQKHTVGEDGKFTAEVPGLGGRYVKAKETEEGIFTHLRSKEALLKIESYAHEYPHCWRCETPLLYYARTSWFAAVNKVRKELLSNNETINWIPGHVKHGRFGEWLKEKKDWNFSRERYWGTPLPVWHCAACKKWEAVGSVDELSRRNASQLRNQYWILRHGQAEHNVKNLVDSGRRTNYHLTSQGERDVLKNAKAFAKKLGSKKIDLILASPLERTKETAAIAAKVLGAPVVEESLLKEIQLPTFTGKPNGSYHNAYPLYEDKFEKIPPEGESLHLLRARMWEAFKKIEATYEGKRILLVSHEYPLWMLTMAAQGWSKKEAIEEQLRRKHEFIATGTVQPLAVRSVPRDKTGLMDLHRPYVDDVELRCNECKGVMRRGKEVIDVWFDSGSMPLAQGHYPFERKEDIDKGKMFPAHYICEAVDQTRGWFYTLLAVSTLLGKKAPYKNVISLGHINDKHGQKMSKSKGNVIDPWEVMGQYGVDAVRWYLYTATPPGEPKNFDPNEVLKTLRKFHTILYNSFVFLKTYGSKKIENRNEKIGKKNPLDLWIRARLTETTAEVTGHLEAYRIREAGVSLESLADDLSRWYIRRSRRRFSGVAKGYKETADYAAASFTLAQVLQETAKLIAPFSPFFGEALYQSVGAEQGSKVVQSVHLEDWPKVNRLKKEEKKILGEMEEVRRLASLALAARAEAGIKVRQPLAELRVKATKLKKAKGLLEILKDEVNVKEVVCNPKMKEEVALDTTITPELRAEGMLRELTRAVQDLRQKAALQQKDKIVLMLDLPEDMAHLIRSQEDALRMEVGAKEIVYRRTDKFTAEAEAKLEDRDIWLGVKKE